MDTGTPMEQIESAFIKIPMLREKKKMDQLKRDPFLVEPRPMKEFSISLKIDYRKTIDINKLIIFEMLLEFQRPRFPHFSLLFFLQYI